MSISHLRVYDFTDSAGTAGGTPHLHTASPHTRVRGSWRQVTVPTCQGTNSS